MLELDEKKFIPVELLVSKSIIEETLTRIRYC
jgi:hypothetical protein